uniref:Putative zinc finger, RING/FYVE/PHD-type n=1 Tax=Helianthus annuus TaxID=4232 RepID=A0A251V8K4_HELAN
MDNFHLDIKWEDITCPICLSFPHNCVLLQCSSYNKGCRPFVCGTDHLHSNCLDRFQVANKMSPGSNSLLTSDESTVINPDATSKPLCPLCRGDVTGWVVIKDARVILNEKERCCENEKCMFTGNFISLREHAEVEHPHARPSKIDPARQVDWDNFQQSSEIIDVLSTIHSEVPHGVVLGDYVIEYGDNGSGDEFEDFPGANGNWWTSCILYQVFSKFRCSRNRRRARVTESRRDSRRMSYDTSNSDDGSVVSTEFADYRADVAENDFVTRSRMSRGRTGHRSLCREDVPLASMIIRWPEDLVWKTSI